jgi:hypothetical protein
MWEVGYVQSCAELELRQWMKVIGQLYYPAALSPWKKRLLYPLNKRMGWIHR